MYVVKSFSTPGAMAKYLNGGTILFSSTVAAISGTDTVTVAAVTMAADGVSTSNYLWVSGQEPTSANNFQGSFPITNVTETVLTVANAATVDPATIRVVTNKPILTADIVSVEKDVSSGVWKLIHIVSDNTF